MREHRVQPTAQTARSGLGRIRHHRGSPSSRRARDCFAHSPRGQRDRRPANQSSHGVWPGRRAFERLRTGYRGVIFLSGEYSGGIGWAVWDWTGGRSWLRGHCCWRRSPPVTRRATSANIKLAPPPEAGPDPSETFVQTYQDIVFEPWGNLPPHSGEMAKLYGDFNTPGPYLVLMKWNPGWFSAPHTYATDRIQVVVFGTWFVNSGNDFQPQDAVPVGPGGYVKRDRAYPALRRRTSRPARPGRYCHLRPWPCRRAAGRPEPAIMASGVTTRELFVTPPP